jgi:hypothetical protein
MSQQEARHLLEERLACAETHLREARRLLTVALPCDELLVAIGAAQVQLERAAELAAGIYAEQCPLRLSPDEFRAEFERNFGPALLQITRR